ncbi:MAG: hypothetical protein WCE46_01500 [Methanoregula sp.]|jgi:hypothetical protein|uniref:hypothetical protein n=1 Tax=Methanoregula sp. TaxID=2052170 RepID=UPI003C779E4D
MPLASEPVRDIESMYHKQDGRVLIEIKLTSVIQLFNSFDPAPFYEKEIDTEAEHYIVDTVQDFPAKTKFMIHIYLPPPLVESQEAKKIIPAIHNHFRYKMLVTERKFRAKFRFGRWSLLIGLTFLAIALVASELIATRTNYLLPQLLSYSLLIIGWAAMWEPVTVLLYELWPIIRLKKIYEKISTMEIEILPLPG